MVATGSTSKSAILRISFGKLFSFLLLLLLLFPETFYIGLDRFRISPVYSRRHQAGYQCYSYSYVATVDFNLN